MARLLPGSGKTRLDCDFGGHRVGSEGCAVQVVVADAEI
jgi:hypothetical protein